jgi:hypothetical protein
MTICRLLWPALLFTQAASAQVPLFGFGRTVYPLPAQYDAVYPSTGNFATKAIFTNVFGMVNTHPATLDIVSNLVYFQISELADGGSTQHIYAIEGVNGTQRHRMSLPNDLLTLFNLYSVNGTLYGYGAQQLTQKIFRINAGAGILTTLGAHTNFAGVQSVAFDPVSNLVYIVTLTADFSANRIAALNATNGAFVSLIPRTNDFSEIFAYRGALYGISPFGGTSTLKRINLASGAETLITVFPTNFGTVGSSVMDHDEGRAYVGGGDSVTNAIRRINVTNGVVEAVYRPRLSYFAIFINPWVTIPDINLPAATVGWRTVSNFTYRVQSAPQVTGAWANVGSLISGLGGRTQITAAAASSATFYRVMTKP